MILILCCVIIYCIYLNHHDKIIKGFMKTPDLVDSTVLCVCCAVHSERKRRETDMFNEYIVHPSFYNV